MSGSELDDLSENWSDSDDDDDLLWLFDDSDDELDEDEKYPFELDSTLYHGLVVDADSNMVLGQVPWFIKFFAPWCPHCQHLKPTWEELHQRLFLECNVATVDCTTEKGSELCKAFGIRGYPTLLYLPPDDSKYYTYRGERTIDGFKQFVR